MSSCVSRPLLVGSLSRQVSKPDSHHDTVVLPLLKGPLASPQDVAQLARQVEQSRVAHGHALNSRSSRSHCLVRLFATSKSGGKVRKQQFLFVDLAGSERTAKSGVDGQRMQEAMQINGSLTVLGRCIRALSSRKAHVPFRDSILTMLWVLFLFSVQLFARGGACRRPCAPVVAETDNHNRHRLRSSFDDKSSKGGGSSYTSVVVAISPEHEEETFCSMRFGERMAQVSNQATKVVGSDAGDEARKLRRQIASLRAEVRDMKAKGMEGGINEGAPTSEAKSLVANIKRYDKAKRLVVKLRTEIVESGGGGKSKALLEAEDYEAIIRDIVMRQKTIKYLWTDPKPKYITAVGELAALEERLRVVG